MGSEIPGDLSKDFEMLAKIQTLHEKGALYAYSFEKEGLKEHTGLGRFIRWLRIGLSPALNNLHFKGMVSQLLGSVERKLKDSNVSQDNIIVSKEAVSNIERIFAINLSSKKEKKETIPHPEIFTEFLKKQLEINTLSNLLGCDLEDINNLNLLVSDPSIKDLDKYYSGKLNSYDYSILKRVERLILDGKFQKLEELAKKPGFERLIEVTRTAQNLIDNRQFLKALDNVNALLLPSGLKIDDRSEENIARLEDFFKYLYHKDEGYLNLPKPIQRSVEKFISEFATMCNLYQSQPPRLQALVSKEFIKRILDQWMDLPEPEKKAKLTESKHEPMIKKPESKVVIPKRKQTETQASNQREVRNFKIYYPSLEDLDETSIKNEVFNYVNQFVYKQIGSEEVASRIGLSEQMRQTLKDQGSKGIYYNEDFINHTLNIAFYAYIERAVRTRPEGMLFENFEKILIEALKVDFPEKTEAQIRQKIVDFGVVA